MSRKIALYRMAGDNRQVMEPEWSYLLLLLFISICGAIKKSCS
jgi:hypothetical protein